MADAIARQWSLGVLQVELNVNRDPPSVRCQIVVNEAGDRRIALVVDDVPLSEFGVPRFFNEVMPSSRSQETPLASSYSTARVRDLDLHVPARITSAVGTWVKGGADDRAVLWLHLVKPYDVLGGVPWEEMRESIGIPVLRLPDVLPDQAAPSGRVDIAMYASAPQVKGSLPLADSALAVFEAAQTLDGECTFHFFTETAVRIQLRARLSSRVRRGRCPTGRPACARRQAPRVEATPGSSG